MKNEKKMRLEMKWEMVDEMVDGEMMNDEI